MRKRITEKRAGGRRRGDVVEFTLRVADRVARAKETMSYYQSLSPKERRENTDWGEIAELAAATLE
jgi:hypothetical protein